MEGNNIGQADFQLLQVKTTQHTTNPAIPQYWRWVGEPERVFKHQVLAAGGGIEPEPHRAAYADEYDFHLRLDGLREIQWALGSNKKPKIMALTRGAVADEGDENDPSTIICGAKVFAQFKHMKTARRFLTFCEQTLNVRVVRINW